MLKAEEAWQEIASRTAPLAAVARPRRACAGLILAAEVAATVDVPAHDVSAMDGYALRGPATQAATLEVLGIVAAGDAPGRELADASTCWRIMTGAPVPPGADRVVPIELTDGGKASVTIRDWPAAGAHVRRRAEVIASGAKLLPPGERLTPGRLALAATHGHRELPVHRPPRVGVLPTGDEVVAPEATPRPGQLRDSHTDFLLAACGAARAEAHALGIAPDDPVKLHEMIARGLEHDVLLLTGGVSMGELDLVEDVLAQEGCSAHFDSVAIQPGKPVVYATHAGGHVFALPGNPASAMVCFWLFVRPALERLIGGTPVFGSAARKATLGTPLVGARGRDRFLPATISGHGDEEVIVVHMPAGSHDLGAYARAEALVRVRAGAEPRDAGETCELWPLPGPL